MPTVDAEEIVEHPVEERADHAGTEADGFGGYFWPGWVLAGWAAFLVIDAYRVFLSAPITGADVDRELRRHA